MNARESAIHASEKRLKDRKKRRALIMRRELKAARENALRLHKSMVCANDYRIASDERGPAAHAHCKMRDCLCECHD